MTRIAVQALCLRWIFLENTPIYSYPLPPAL